MPENDVISLEKTDIGKITTARKNVRLALEASADWRKQAKEDYLFVQGKQWDDKDVESMKKQKRPTITINRCRPLINQVSGYFGKNLSEATFLPKGKGDDEVCRIAKGITKYVYDKANFKRNKKKVIKDRLICGVGYYWVYYDFDYDVMDGCIKIERRSPFEVFIDPESKQDDLSDAAFCGVYSWESPDELKKVYPEVAEEIGGLEHKYDAEEVAADTTQTVAGEPLWYSKQLKKLRVCQYWYREKTFRNVYVIDGQGQLEEADVSPEIIAMAKLKVPGVKKHRVPTWQYKYMVFADDVLLEESNSPYKHNRYPLVPEYSYRTGERDENDTSLEPAGIIRDLKDVQRELNKQRSQRMHIVNTQANGFWLVFGTSTPEFDQQLKNSATTPGAIFNPPPGVTDIKYISSPGVSTANIEMEQSVSNDFYSISGVNPESMSSSQIPASMSGVAIDRRQGAMFTQVSDLAEESNFSESLIIDRLWGSKGRQGLIQQYFTESQVMRIIGDEDEQMFVNVQPGLPQAKVEQPKIDPMTGQPMINESGQVINEILFDLTKFEFDIKVEPSEMTPTMQQAIAFQLIDAAKNGIPIPADLLVEYIPMTNRAEVKKRMREKEEQQKPEPPKTSLSISFDDLPVEAKAAVLAANGIQVDPASIAQQDMMDMQMKNMHQQGKQQGQQQQPNFF